MKVVYLILLFTVLQLPLHAKVVPSKYGITQFADSNLILESSKQYADSLLRFNKLLSSTKVFSDVEQFRFIEFQTINFYLIICLFLILGTIRFIDIKYFNNLWRALIHPNLSGGQLKEQIQNSGILNLFMNIFFTISIGTYLYFLGKYFTTPSYGVIPTWVLLILLVTSISIIYLLKYIAVKFSGWVFRVEEITEFYLFNVFLINKITGIVLLPFIAIIAFSEREFAQQMIIVSIVLATILFVLRYVRSWQVFGSFFHFSKFHFFMYLCASEIMPIAILLKLLSVGLKFN